MPNQVDDFNTATRIFSIANILFVVVFMAIVVILIVTIISRAKRTNKNNNSPVLTVGAKLVAKRSDMRNYNHKNSTNDFNNMSSYTDYYATFEVQSGDRMEFKIDGSEYGMIIEGDSGNLTFQGTRYMKFERK